ncbi:hypothetical protein [Mycolicibacterium sp. CBMA 335]|uniref:hypothetical protein n=1 Tax=Mycolicibacterium sp. CBMA 335 TaxID=2606603 RepID=UPI001EE47E3D|nr:hypothetical protein [Mycolicibacterium sp. CBMA 335]
MTFDIAPEALRRIISEGRLGEFANKAAAHAAAQVNAQVVDLVSKAAIDNSTIADGLSVSFSAVFEGGDFGTVGPRGPHGPRPHVGVVFGESALSQVVAINSAERFQ